MDKKIKTQPFEADQIFFLKYVKKKPRKIPQNSPTGYIKFFDKITIIERKIQVKAINGGEQTNKNKSTRKTRKGKWMTGSRKYPGSQS